MVFLSSSMLGRGTEISKWTHSSYSTVAYHLGQPSEVCVVTVEERDPKNHL